MQVLFRVGPFVVDKAIGEGGMGRVLLARHERTGVPVALKVDLRAATPRNVAAFAHEVHLIAALRHAHVVMTLDHGVADFSGVAGLEGMHPWQAMELAGGGSVEDTPPNDWQETKHVVGGLLTALAHAHAHGIVHRDVKPANLLLAGPRAETASVPDSLLAARVVLSDFGVSHRAETLTDRSDRAVGTPFFMAPELIEGDWRSQGPWTDLYAVGVLLWLFTTRDFPFIGSRSKVMIGHMSRPLPDFDPVMAVPDGLQALLRRLLNKEPGDRYLFAADALKALRQLETEEPWSNSPTVHDLAPVALSSDAPTEVARPFGSPRPHRTPLRGAWTPVPFAVAPGPGWNAQLEDVGMSLYGVRSLPLVGRVVEQQALWDALLEVVASRSARFVLLRGQTGMGKSRLAHWLATEAHEVGAAIPLLARHGPSQGGIVEMLRRDLYLIGLTREEVLARLETVFIDGLDVNLLAHLLGGPELKHRWVGAPEVRLVLAMAVGALAGDRGVVIWLDDVHWSAQTLEWVDLVLARQRVNPSPLLIVATVEDAALAENPDAQELIEDLVEDPMCAVLDIGPLKPTDHRTLVRELLNLDGALAKQVEERTAGNPMFAVQLVGHWVSEGLLEPTSTGFRLKSDRAPALPMEIRSVWSERVGAVLALLEPAQCEVLEIAAVLGVEVNDEELEEVSRRLGLEVLPSLKELLMARHLAWSPRHASESWYFTHGLVREALLARYVGTDRWRGHHEACARMLLARPEASKSRIAEHAIEGGLLEEAIEPLVAAASNELDSLDLRSGRLLDRLERVFSELGVPDDDARWATLWLLQCWRARLRGDLDTARRFVGKAERAARRHGWELELARAIRVAAKIAVTTADYDGAWELLQDAQKRFLALGDPIRAADCRYVMGQILDRNDPPAARAMYESCTEAFSTEDAWMYAHLAPAGIALTYNREGDHEAMAPHLARARTLASAAGFRHVAGMVSNLQGEAARASGDLTRAAELYLESANHYRALGDPEAIVPLINLAIVFLERSQFTLAIDTTGPLLDQCLEKSQAAYTPYTLMVLMAAHAGRGDTALATQHLRRLTGLLKDTALVDRDIAREFARTAGLTEDGELRSLAASTAVAQFSALGLDEAAEVLRERFAVGVPT